MLATIDQHLIHLNEPIDISIPLSNTPENPIAWYQDLPKIEPVIMGDWIGKVSEGKSSTNFNNVFFNPHAHGTHTECLGHITHEFYSIQDCLKKFHFWAQLVSITPKKIGEDLVIDKELVEFALQSKTPEALIIRTLPNSENKKHQNYSHTNPAYLTEDTALYIKEKNIQHLLIDLPSVDKEKDDGLLLAHKAFWNVKNTQQLNADARMHCSITEMIFVPNQITDGEYLLQLQITSLVNDASPSKPILYAIKS